MKPNKTIFKQTEIGMIPEDWEVKELGEEIELAYGKGLIENKRVFGEYPVFGSNGIIGFHAEAFVKGPGIIIGRKGSVGEVKFSRKDFWPIDTTYYVKLKKQGNIFFWYYFLMSLGLNKLNSHSAVPGLNRDQVYQIVSKIPPLSEQSAIAKILSSLDAKIELNQQINKTLEEIGKALFKHWFVDFEFPNEEGKPYKSSGGEMEYNEELGKDIPKGWEVNNALNLFKLEYGWHLPEWDRNEGNIPVFGSGGLTGFHNQYFVKGPGIILGRAGKIGPDSVYYSHIPFCPLETTFYVSTENKKIIRFLFYFLKTMSMINTGSSVPNLSRNSIHNAKIIIPTMEIIEYFDNLTKKIFDKIYENQHQIKLLSQIRDSLLPKLMSGKIRVPIE